MVLAKLSPLFEGELQEYCTTVTAVLDSRVAESEVKYPTPTPDSDLSKISDSRLRHLYIKGMKFGCC